MSEVKITIEWDGNSAGLHAEPMTVHIAGKADPNEIIGAVAEAMGFRKNNPRRDEGFIHIEPKSDGVTVKCPGGEERSFPTYRTAVDWISNDYGNR